MSIIYSEELSTANGSNMLEVLNNLRTDSEVLSNKILDFTSNFDEYLIGDVAPIVKSKWNLLLDALKKQDMICENLISGIKAANNTMIGYVENYEMIDNEKEEEIADILSQIDSLIYSIQNEIEETNDKGKVKQLYDLTDLTLKKETLQRYYEKIKGLAGADASAYSKIADIALDITNYSNAISKVNIGFTSKSTFCYPGKRAILYFSQEGYYLNGVHYKWKSDWISYGGKDIAEGGCGPTSLAMAIGTIFHDSSITPAVIADIMDGNNSSGKKWTNHGGDFVKNVSNEYGLNCQKSSFDGDTIEAVIKAGGAFICAARDGDHYIAITDVVYKDGERYFIECDPYPSNNADLEEPRLVSEKQFLLENNSTKESEGGIEGGIGKIKMNFYITPSNVEINYNPENKKIESLTDANNSEVVWERN